MERRCAGLAPEERELLAVACVCGVEFELDTLADVMQRDASGLGARCDERGRRGQWLSGPALARQGDGSVSARYAFRHALYRQVFYQRIGTLARVRWHERA